LLIIN